MTRTFHVRRKATAGYLSDGKYFPVEAESAKEAAENFRADICLDSHPFDVEVLVPGGQLFTFHTKLAFVAEVAQEPAMCMIDRAWRDQ